MNKGGIFILGIVLAFFAGLLAFTGYSIFGSISLGILNPEIILNISSPENKSYEFGKFDTFLIDLNVSANSNIESWWFSLFDLRHGVFIYENISFVPNTSFVASRWNNLLTVYANDSIGRMGNASVEFFILVNNTAPTLGNISSVWACEGSVTPQVLINATDIDEDDLSFVIEPSVKFFINNYFNQTKQPYLTYAETLLFSGTLGKADVGNYSRNISVVDNNAFPGPLLDRKSFNISVIEINNFPLVYDSIGVQTVWSRGENSTLLEFFGVSDVEKTVYGFNLSYNSTFLSGSELFKINSSNGLINFTANSSQVGNYIVRVCSTDGGLPLAKIHPNITNVCGSTGGNLSVCEDFQLTVTDLNRAPRFVNYTPINLSFFASGGVNLYFNVTEYDPDGTFPDTYWYVDNSLIEYDNMSLFDEFNYAFGCGISGVHYVKVVATDGELNASLQWNVSVQGVACPSSPPSGGGGGGGGGGGSTRPSCQTQWACNSWESCLNVEEGLNKGEVSGEIYREIKDSCDAERWGEEFCGYQNRFCSDLSFCNVTRGKPVEVQYCYYTLNPSCSDGIKNCHGGSCELLVDCGGSCDACPTCSDGIQNQGEEGLDCGGPCPTQCPVELPLRKVNYYYLIPILLLLLIVLIIYLRYRKMKREI